MTDSMPLPTLPPAAPLEGPIRLERRDRTGDNIRLIKAVREITGWGLLDTKIRCMDWPEFNTDLATATKLIPLGFAVISPASPETDKDMLLVWKYLDPNLLGGNKIEAIKSLRSYMNLGLREAKDMIEGGPFRAPYGTALKLLTTGHFTTTDKSPAPSLASVTVQDIRALVYLAREGLHALQGTVDAPTLAEITAKVEFLSKL